VKERAKKRKKEKERIFERLQGVVLRICYQKFHVHILSWYVLILDSNIYILFGWFVALGYSTIASLE
jgi:hypothetical protein